MSVNKDYQAKVLRMLKEESLESRMFGATFAAGAEDGSGAIAHALFAFLEDERWNTSHANDNRFGVIFGRAIVGLVSSAIRANCPTEFKSLVKVKVDQFIDSDDFQIRAHAVFARQMLSGEQPVNLHRH